MQLRAAISIFEHTKPDSCLLPWPCAAIRALQSRAHDMLLCDGCDLGFHTFCLDPPLSAAPLASWYCPHCLPEQVRRPLCVGACDVGEPPGMQQGFCWAAPGHIHMGQAYAQKLG